MCPVIPRALILLAALLLLPACTQTVQVGCGPITDDLRTVRGATAADQDRIDVHYVRGRAAGCWR